MPAIAALISGGVGGAFDLAGGLLGARGERKAVSKQNAQNEAQRAAAFRYLQGVQSQDALFAGLEDAALKSAHKKQLAGFKGARAATDLGATAARQTVLGRSKQGQADLEQSAVSRGLLGTSTGAQAFTGLKDRTTALLGGIDQQLAQAMADLGLQESELQGQQGLQLAGLAGKNRQANTDFGFELASLAPRLTRQQTVGLREGLFGTTPGTGSQRYRLDLAALLGGG